jgi:hypothetical protein
MSGRKPVTCSQAARIASEIATKRLGRDVVFTSQRMQARWKESQIERCVVEDAPRMFDGDAFATWLAAWIARDGARQAAKRSATVDASEYELA